MNSVIKHIVHLIGLILIQILVIDQISFGSLNAYISPIIIGTGIIILPAGWPSNRLLLIAFFVGILLDSFHNTLGINTSALLLLAFLRPLVLKIVSPREGFESFVEPTVLNLKIGKYAIYASILFLCYHLTYFFLESLNSDTVLIILLKTLLSTIAALFLSLLYQYLTIKKQ
jgi:hypothetical protein